MMIKQIVFNLLFLLTVYSVVGQSINSTNSAVSFEISNFGVNTVEGSFTGMAGEVSFSPDDLSNSTFAVCIDAKSIDTENEKRDEHLRKEDFFDVVTYPEICFNSTEITKTNDGYTAIGILTMHGQSNNCEIPFSVNDQIFKGVFTIDRQDYGVGPSGGFMVGKEVEIQIVCEIE